MLRTVFARIRRQSVNWWSQAESNRRPLECHSSALPTELWPQLKDAGRERPRPENACRDPLAPRDLFRVFRVFATLLEHFQEKWNPLVDPKIPPTPASMPPA